MFRKLISNLPFNPSLLGQVTFYAQRMKQEESLRRLGMGFVVLAMFVQMFAVMAPPEKSLASDGNAHILDGAQTRDDLLRAWDNPNSDFAAIYTRLGLNRDDIAHLTHKPNVTVHSNYADYWTIGRTSLSSPSLAHRGIAQQYKNAEVAINTGPTVVYLRQLRAWDILSSMNKYVAWEGWKNGKQFFILRDCGNFTQVDPVLTPPALETMKSIEGNPSTLKPGDEFTFHFHYRNKVPESIPANNVNLEDDLDLKHFDIVNFSYPLKPGASIQSYLHHSNSTGMRSFLSLPLGMVGWTPNYQLAASIRVRIKANVPDSTRICNISKLASISTAYARSNAADAWSKSVCVTVDTPEMCPYNQKLPVDHPDCKECPYKPGTWIKDRGCTPPPPEMCPLDGTIKKTDPNCKPCPYNSSIAVNNPKCVEPEKCPLDQALLASDPACKAPRPKCKITKFTFDNTTREATFTTEVTPQHRFVTITGYDYDFGDDTKTTQRTNAYSHSMKHVYAEGDYTATVKVNYTLGVTRATQTTGSADCSTYVSHGPLTLAKEVKNLSQNLDNTAAQQKAAKMKAGDVLEYSLTITNPYDYDRGNVNFNDPIYDLLDYADLDMSFLSQQGGSFDAENKVISWSGQAVPASGSLTKNFRVTLKSSLPSTNRPSQTSPAFDCFMTNKFGNEIQLAVDCPVQKDIETAMTTLPKTGPGSSLLIGFIASSVIAYFFARSRLLGQELELIRSDFAQTGGI